MNIKGVIHEDKRNIEYARQYFNADTGELLETIFPTKCGRCCMISQNKNLAMTHAFERATHMDFDFERYCYDTHGNGHRERDLNFSKGEIKHLTGFRFIY